MARVELSFSRIAERARRAARGSVPPAGVDPRAQPADPDGRHRRAIRQRLRRSRAVRRARVAELGALVADMQARGRWNQRLVDDWGRELDRNATELGELERALRGDVRLDELKERRVVAECAGCGRLAGADDRYCAGCGRELEANLSTMGRS
jgi:hypothetical protein